MSAIDYAPLCQNTPMQSAVQSAVSIDSERGLQLQQQTQQQQPQPAKAATMSDDALALKAICCSWLNVLLVCCPLGIASQLMEWSSALTFSLNFIAIIPLAAILSSATESLAEHTGEMIGGLVNATFGNAVEMILTVQAIRANLLRIVQGSLMGSILSNLLLVLGMSFVLGGIRFSEQSFNISGASANSSILLVAIIGVGLPTFFSQMPEAKPRDTVTISRICAIILAIIYGLFLFFQLKSHKHFFEDTDEVTRRKISVGEVVSIASKEGSRSQDLKRGTSKGSSGVKEVPYNCRASEADDEDSPPPLSPCKAVGVLFASTVVIAVNSEFLVESIEPVARIYGIPKAFIGLILLPIVGNAAEHMSAVAAAGKGRMELALGIAVGSSCQVALLVVPFAVIMGWIYGKPMTLSFRGFDTAVLMLSVFLVASVLQDGSSNWLEGVMLIAVYLMVAVITCFITEAD